MGRARADLTESFREIASQAAFGACAALGVGLAAGLAGVDLRIMCAVALSVGLTATIAANVGQSAAHGWAMTGVLAGAMFVVAGAVESSAPMWERGVDAAAGLCVLALGARVAASSRARPGAVL